MLGQQLLSYWDTLDFNGVIVLPVFFTFLLLLGIFIFAVFASVLIIVFFLIFDLFIVLLVSLLLLALHRLCLQLVEDVLNLPLELLITVPHHVLEHLCHPKLICQVL